MANLTSSLLVKLIDGVSGPARKAAASLLGIGRAANGIGGMQGRLNASIERTSRALDRARGQMIDASAQAYGFFRAISAPIAAAEKLETVLEDAGQKADLPQERLGALGVRIRDVARKTNQATIEMAKGFDTLVGFGASADDALGLLPTIGKAATAYRANVDDFSRAGYAALDNLKVPANEFARALDAMAQAGKDGAFELRDMAQYFPSLGAAYQGLNQRGVPAVADLAAALQIVRKGAGDSSEAANNLANVLQKISSPGTRKNFKKLGINLEKELKKAADKGLTPIEAIAEITNKALKGDLGKLGDLFEDRQVQQGLRPLIQNIDEYRRIRAEALKAQGIVEADYERRLKTHLGAMQRFRAGMDNLSASLGAALLPAINDLMDKIGPVIDRFARFAEENPKVISAITQITGAVIGLRLAIASLRWLGVGAALSFLQTASLVASGTAAGSAFGKAFAAAARVAIIAGIALAAAELLQYFDPKGNLGGLTKPVDDFLRKKLGLPEKDTGITPGEIWTGLTSGGKTDPAAEQAKAQAQAKRDELDAMTKDWPAAAQRAIKSYGNALVQGGAEAETQAASIGERVKDALTVEGKPTVDTADLERALTLAREVAAAVRSAGGVTPKGPQPQPLAGKRATGGPVYGDRPYLVGERGPEIITPSRSGYVHPNGSAPGGTYNIGVEVGVKIERDLAKAIGEIERQFSERLRAALRGLQADYGFGAA